MFYHRVVLTKYAEGIVNSIDPVWLGLSLLRTYMTVLKILQMSMNEHKPTETDRLCAKSLASIVEMLKDDTKVFPFTLNEMLMRRINGR